MMTSSRTWSAEAPSRKLPAAVLRRLQRRSSISDLGGERRSIPLPRRFVNLKGKLEFSCGDTARNVVIRFS